ncbi:MAG: radical SAM protein [Candidatus Omnitrophota bacterium]
MPSINNKIELLKKANGLFADSLKNCKICPRKCGVNRMSGKLGYCRAGHNPKIYSTMVHRGEEPPISGSKGSGTIFFSHCNMKCVYCQNYYFSQLDQGQEMTIEKLAAKMCDLQKSGCHNINLVSPSHYVPQILLALQIAIEKGLKIPIIYNTSGYDLAETIRLLGGIIDIYLPDMRYSDDEMAKRYSGAPKYTEYNRQSVLEMQRQTGTLILDDDGIAIKGLIIRLLALPENISGTIESLKFIKENISTDTCLSIMSQYYPTYRSCNYKEISRGVTEDEYKNVVDAAHDLGLNNGWIQEMYKEDKGRFFGTNINPTT